MLLAATGLVLLLLLRRDSGAPTVPFSEVPSSATTRPDRAPPPVAGNEALVREPAPVGSAPVAARPTVRLVATLPGRAPAAAAVVRYGPWEQHPSSRATAAEDREAWLADNGKVVTADGDGVATLDLGEAASAMVSIRCGDHYGEADVDAGDGTVRVELQRDEPLPVQVVDSDGRPLAGFTVRIEIEAESRRAGRCEHSFRLVTDAKGMAFVPHTQRLSMPGPDVFAWSMQLRVDTDPAVERTISATELRTERPLRLVLAAGGAIAVTIAGADGRTLWASATLADPATGTAREDDRDDGVSWFRQLPLGRRWTLSVESWGHTVQREIAGPTRVDEVVHTRVDLPLRNLELRGRIVRPDGVPVPGADIALTAAAAECFHDNKTKSRDGSLGDTIGNFAFHGVLPADVAIVTGAILNIERRPHCAPTTIALAPLRPGENDLGDVVVAVDADEVLLASVEVHAGGRNVSAHAHAFLCGRGDSGVNTVTMFAANRSDRITFHGPPTTRELDVGCSFAGFLYERAPVLLGQHVLVELEPAAQLTVHLLLPPVPHSLLTAELTDAMGRQRGSHHRIDDGFEWRDIEPGRYRLRILADEQPVHESAFDLARGDNVWPQDGALDLRRAVRAFHVAITGDDGSDVPQPETFAVPAGAAAPPEGFDPRAIRLRDDTWFVPRPNAVDLVIAAAGFVPVRIPQPTADTAVRLVRCTTLRVHTAPGEDTNTIVRVVEEPLRDPWLRALDTRNLHGTDSISFRAEPDEYSCVPGTVVEVLVERSGTPGTAQRIVIGSTTVECTAR